MIDRAWILLIFLAIVSCSPDKPDMKSIAGIPHDSILPHETMIRLLTDVHITEAALLRNRDKGKNTDTLTIRSYNMIFTKYRISRTRYEQNLKYYQADPEKMSQMYNEIAKALDVRIGQRRKADSMGARR